MDHRNFYGRIKGKALNAAQHRYLEEDLPGLLVAGITREENPERAALDMQELAGDRPLWLEIGFGGGEHLGMNRPIYQRTAAYGHFGRAPEADGGFSWEKTDLVEALKKAV